MLSSGAGGLESALQDVEPILHGNGDFQFTHPSFQEVLAARQCAGEINSGKLSVRDAFNRLWIYDMANDEEFQLFHSIQRPYGALHLFDNWKASLHHMVGILDEKKAEEFIDVMGETYEDRLQKPYDRRELDDYILEDLAICARFIGEHPALHENKRVKQILDGLLGVACQCSTSPGQSVIDERSRSAKTALSMTKSSYAAMGLINYIISCGHEFHGEWDYDASLGSKDEAVKAVDALVKSGVKIDENSFIDYICSNHDLNKDDFVMLNYFCGLKSIEHVIKVLSREDVFRKFGRGSTVFYECISVALKEIRSHGFKPELIVSFNNTITESQNGTLMYEYHHTLFDFAKDFNWIYSTDLYKLLEKNKMQFWDYWMVYTPK